MREGWRKGEFRDCISEITSGKSVNSLDEPATGKQFGVLKTSCVYNGYFDPHENKRVVENETHLVKCHARKGTIVVSRMNTAALVGASGLIEADYPNLFLPDRLWLVSAKSTIDIRWFASVVGSPGVRRRLSDSASGTSATMKNISQESFLNTPVLIPPLPEQRKIAAILRTWDLGLEKLSALRKAKERRFVGLRQRLFGGRGGYTGHWQFKPLSAITTRVRRKNDGGDHPVMTISAKSGFLMQSDKFARDMAGSSAERYTLLHQGEFAYNKGNSLTAPYGCIYELDRPTAVVPFVYYSFALNAGLDTMFFKHLFSGGILNHQLSRVINSGVRNDGLLNLDVDDFFGCKVPVPPIEEQREIGRILTTAKSELDLLDREIAALRRQKRGLMQKLLTGEWAVQVGGVAA